MKSFLDFFDKKEQSPPQIKKSLTFSKSDNPSLLSQPSSTTRVWGEYNFNFTFRT